MQINTNTYIFGRILEKVRPHAPRYLTASAIDGVLLDSDGTRLHVVASDRYTMAVARTKLSKPGKPHTRLIHRAHLDTLTAWLDDGDEHEDLTITSADDYTEFVSVLGTLRFPVLHRDPFPAWRPIFRNATSSLGEANITVLNADFLPRWKDAGTGLRVWQTGDDKPLILAGVDFIGMQMPMKAGSLGSQHLASRDSVISEWADSFGDADGADPEAALPLADSAPLDDVARGLLKQVLLSTVDLREEPSNDPAAVAAHALVGTHAWAEYRLLKALAKLDPRAAIQVVDLANEELEGGDFHELAWDAALEAGHDPQQWTDDHTARIRAAHNTAA